MGAPSIVDVDGDGIPEILVGSTLLNNEGITIFSEKDVGNSNYGAVSTAADLNLDGNLDIVSGFSAYNHDGTPLFINSKSGYPAIGNFDEDPNPEIVVVRVGNVYLLEHDGTTKWGPVSLGGGQGGPPTIADFDNDGAPEIGVAGSGYYSVFDTDGSLLWRQNISDFSSNITGSSVFDFDGDGSAEVVYNDEYYLRIFAGSTGEILFETLNPSCTVLEYPIIVDVDNDGHAEIVVARNQICGIAGSVGIENSGIFVYGDKKKNWVGTRRIWNQHAYHITNVHEDGTIPQHEQPNWLTPNLNNFRQNIPLPGENIVFAAADLVPSYLRIDASNCPTSVNVQVRIGNGGSAPAPGGITVSIYFGDPNGNGIIVGTVHTTISLNPGQYEDLTLTVELPNQVPEITSTPIMGAVEGETYAYDVEARDPDGDALAFSLEGAPSEMTLNLVSGLIQWTPTIQDLGDHEITVHVIDGFGGTASQSFTITVSRGVNYPPNIISLPVTNASEGELYTYMAVATDENGDPLTFNLVTHPNQMNVNSFSGLVQWTPSSTQAGFHSIDLSVFDGRGGVDIQSFVIEVADLLNNAPTITSIPVMTATENIAYHYQLSATDPDGDLLVYALSTGPAGMTVDSQTSLLQWTPDANQLGAHSVLVLVSDGRGGTDSQSFYVETEAWINQDPVITSLPLLLANRFQDYRYQVTAYDPENQPLTYQLIQSPVDMTIDFQSGLINWNPQDEGSAQVHLLVQDDFGGEANQRFSILVPFSNNSDPVITSIPIETGKVSTLYHYQVTATDVDGYPLYYYLDQAPSGMTINPVSGLIAWVPNNSQLGVSPVQVCVEDTMAATDCQSYYIEISAQEDSTPPDISVTAVPPTVLPGEEVLITVVATDDQGVVNRNLTVHEIPHTLDQNSQAIFQSEEPGLFVVLATAQDAAGNSAQALTEIRVMDPEDTDAPIVQIISPDRDTELTAPTTIWGTVQDANLAYYTLEYRKIGSNCTSSLAYGTQERLESALAQFDPTLLANGLYELTLTAEDVNGQTSRASTVYRVDGQMKVGRFTITFEDVSVPLKGIPIQVHRTFDSAEKCPGDFGFGWNLADIDVQENILFADQWSYRKEMVAGSLGTLADFCVEGITEHYVNVTFPGGKTEQFDLALSVTAGSGPCISNQMPDLMYPYLEAREGTLSRLSFAQNEQLLFRNVLDGFKLLTWDFSLWDPAGYLLKTVEGLTYRLSERDGLLSITDLEGNSVIYRKDGYTHSSGTGVYFTRDSEGRITEIRDPQGRKTRYSYDPYGNLSSVTDPLGNIVRYTYDDQHNLIEIIDPLNQVPAMYFYDEDGRLIAQEDAYGNRIEYEHDITGRQEIIRDRNQNLTVHLFDDRGNILQTTDAIGQTTFYTYDENDHELTKTIAVGTPLEATTSRTYDVSGNITTEIDPLGHTMTYTYDERNNPLSINNDQGHTTSFTYNEYAFPLTITDPLGEVTSSEYTLGTGNLVVTTTDPGDNVTISEQNWKGYIVREVDAQGTETSYSYDPNGNELTQTTSRTDASGQTVTLTWEKVYDAKSRVIEEIDPQGNSTTTEYDANGNVVATVDALQHRTTYSYNAISKKTKTIYPDGSIEITTYDADGNQLTTTDRQGLMTRYEYDALSRIVQTTYADGTTTGQSYDVAGRVDQVTDQKGFTTTYEYDLAGRRTSVTDARSNSSSYTYDSSGNQLSFTDALGHTTQFEYDLKNRRTKTIYHDSSFTSVTYNALDQKIAETDQADNTTHFDYDANGQLIKVIDTLGQETSFTYDEQGNKLTQTDALLRTTGWECDDLGRVTKRTLPLGQFEIMEYNDNGNLTSKTDFNGETITFTYGSLGRLTEKTYQNGLSVTTTYTASGQRGTVADERGTTSYFYDLSNRLQTQTNPDGTWLQYGYDANGNRTVLETQNGITTYSCDSLNRLDTVIDTDGNTTVTNYDAVGNRSVITNSNGTRTSYTYDTLNRLTYLENANRNGSIISSYTYTLGPAGNRQSVVENTGRRVDYTYDNLYRLTEEAITDPVRGNETISYTYDSVGNRLTKTDNSGTVSSTYDDNDRILTSGSTLYSYDDNGNKVLEDGDGLFTEYLWDQENRLIQATTLTDTLKYEYDFKGIRTKSIVNGIETKYLVDTNLEFAQVLEEWDENGDLIVSYLYGDDRISQNRYGIVHFYHKDGHGSTSSLSNFNEETTDQYLYDAFGKLLWFSGETENSYLYTGEQFDNNLNSYYLRSRFYDPALGRFKSLDTWGGCDRCPQKLNKYSYVENNPVNLLDPSGLFSLQDLSQSLKAIANNATQSQATFRLVVKKTGCLVIETFVEEAITHGIYIFIDNILGVPYVGKTKNLIDLRLKQHASQGARQVGRIIAKFKVVGGPEELAIIEQLIHDTMKKFTKLSNINNPISPTRPSKKVLRERLRKIKLCK